MKNETSENMVMIPVEHFFSGLKTDVDVYIQLGENKYVMIIKAGESYDSEQLKRYQVKNLTHLHIRKDQYGLFLKKQVSVAGIVIANDKFTLDKKTQVVSKVAATIYKSIQKLGFNAVSYESAKEVSNHVITLVESDLTLAGLFESLKKTSEDALIHSIAVSFMAPMIARKMDWERKETLEKLSLGGLLHDIGEKEVNPATLTKPRTEWTHQEVEEYESHPYRGMMILSKVKEVPEDIITIVYEHHENSMGQGFPRRLRDMKIRPLARVVAVADAFCELTVKSHMNMEPLTPEQALSHIELVMGQPFNKEAFAGLKKLVQDSQTKKVAA